MRTYESTNSTMAFWLVVSDPVAVLDMVLAGNNIAGRMADWQHRAVPSSQVVNH